MAFPMLAFAAISAGASIYSGFQKKGALQAEGAAIAKEGETIYQESLKEAETIRREGEIFAQKQSLQYIASGVVLGGSALITLKQTKMFAEESASATERRGKAARDLGYEKQKIAGREGNASIISGFGNAALSVLSAYPGK